MSFTSKRAIPVAAQQANKVHGTPGNSVSSRKKESARLKKMGLSKPVAFNIKANTHSNYMARWKYVKKLMDREHRKHFAVIPHRAKPVDSDASEPPILVGVIGPRKVGKSLLIKSLVRHYTKNKLSDCRGPLTITANKHRRITFIECPSGNLETMIDLSKVCDLSLLLVDASYGFEMDTFEYLNACQQFGFHRIMGVLTHLDKFRKLKTKQSIVYHVKHRFWKEIYAGAKLFVLKGVDERSNAGLYYKSDVLNLVKFISVLKFRPLSWRNSHPYVLVDRYEDLTEPAKMERTPKMDKTIAFYGYVRGCNLRRTMSVHIPGVGDFTPKDLEEMEDPVPLAKKRMRHLMKTGRVYAPMANLGPVVFDKHAAYITLRDQESAQRYDDKKHSWESEEVYLARMKRKAELAKAKEWAKKGNDADGEGGGGSMMVDEFGGDLDEFSQQKKLDGELVNIHDQVTSMMIDRMNKSGISIDESMKSSTMKIFADSGTALKSRDMDELEQHNAFANKMNALERSRVKRTTFGLNSDSMSEPRKRRAVRFDEEARKAVYDDSAIFSDEVKKSGRTLNDGNESDDSSGYFSSDEEPNEGGTREFVNEDDEMKEDESSMVAARANPVSDSNNEDWSEFNADFGNFLDEGEDEGFPDEEEVGAMDEGGFDFNDGLMRNLKNVNEEWDAGMLEKEKVESASQKHLKDDQRLVEDLQNDESLKKNTPRLETDRSVEELSGNLLRTLKHDKEMAKAAKKARRTGRSSEGSSYQTGGRKNGEDVPDLVRSTEEDSAARWKQHLLAQATEIWKPKMSLFEWVYGEDTAAQKRAKMGESKMEDDGGESEDSSSEDELDGFFRVKGSDKRRKKKADMIAAGSLSKAVTADPLNTLDSCVSVPLSKMRIGLDQWSESDKRETIRNRFVTGDWVAAKKWESEVEKRAHNINPDLFDDKVKQDKEILESLGARTMENPENRVYEGTLDWEYRLEQMMKEKGVSGELSMEEKISFAQQNARSDTLTGNTQDSLADRKRHKKAQFNASFDAGSLDEHQKDEDEHEMDHDHSGVVSNKNDDRRSLKTDEVFRPVIPGKGEYYMDIVRDEMKKQQLLNAQEFADETDDVKNELRGFIPGAYVRIIIENVPYEFDAHFDLRYPLIIGGLLPQEMEYGLLLCRVKKHRWYKRLLKSNDPIVISNGWRRFQTMPVFCMEDRSISSLNQRLRFIKYTPSNLHCLCLYYGPLSAPNDGIFGYVNKMNNDLDMDEYSVALTGYVVSSNLTYKCVKKLKIVGSPYEIHKNTCFIKGMFTSNLEVSKFINAKIKTVSGIRGMIKKSEGRFGNFRATFEDKLIKSDIVFLKTWVMVVPKSVYFPVKNLLLSDKESWKGIRTLGKLKYDLKKGVESSSSKSKSKLKLKLKLNPDSNAFKPDSVYVRRVSRKQITDTPLKLSDKLQRELPFALRPKQKEETNSARSIEGVPLRYTDHDTEKKQELIAMIHTISGDAKYRETQMKNKLRKRKRKLDKSKRSEQKKLKRARIARKLSGAEGPQSKFEATRGNKFYKEWRLQKKK